MKNGNWLFWLIGILSIFFMGFILYENYIYATQLGLQKQGVFGDMFGASNALFTGLSFTGVIIAILLQRQELKLQRNELELTREEMKLTRDEFNQQNQTLTKQQFEKRYFQMISMYRDNTDIISVKFKGVNSTGKEMFHYFHKDLVNAFHDHMKKRFDDDKGNVDLIGDYYTHVEEEKLKFTINELVAIFEKRSKQIEDELTKYFATLTIILKLINESNINDKFFYVSILKSHFTKYETLILFYHTISLDIDSNLRRLIDKFNLVDDLEVNLITNPNHFINYKQKQFLNQSYFAMS